MSATPASILASHPPEIRKLASEVRRVIRRELPDAEERAYPGWQAIGYHTELAGYVCGIFPSRRFVKLGFERGTSLRDPRGILTGEGSRVRYVVVRPGERIPEREIVALLRQAAGLSRR